MSFQSAPVKQKPKKSSYVEKLLKTHPLQLFNNTQDRQVSVRKKRLLKNILGNKSFWLFKQNCAIIKKSTKNTTKSVTNPNCFIRSPLDYNGMIYDQVYNVYFLFTMNDLNNIQLTPDKANHQIPSYNRRTWK